jgi:hypothetical protein
MITPWIFYENPLNILNEYTPYIFPHIKKALYPNKVLENLPDISKCGC